MERIERERKNDSACVNSRRVSNFFPLCLNSNNGNDNNRKSGRKIKISLFQTFLLSNNKNKYKNKNNFQTRLCLRKTPDTQIEEKNPPEIFCFLTIDS